MEEIKSYFDEKVAEIVQASSKPKKILRWKMPGNERQFEHNESLLQCIRATKSLIAADKKEQAIDKLKDLESVVNKRIKLIKIADRSEAGWAAANEYEDADALGSDSEDEKRIKRADAQALKKRKLSQTKKSVGFQASGSSDNFQGGYRRTASTSDQRFFRGSDQPSSAGRKSFKYEDKCFACGLPGHWRINCPTTTDRKFK